MKNQVRIAPLAARQITEIQHWYEMSRPTLGITFLRQLKELFGSIQAMPNKYPVFDGGIRKAGMKTFPYLVLFRLQEDVVIVTAVYHGKRDLKKR